MRQEPWSKGTIITELCPALITTVFFWFCGEMRALFFFESRGPKTGSVRKKQQWLSYCLQVYERFQEKKLRREREQVGMTTDEISGRPQSFLTIRFTECWNWSLREFLGWPFPGKKCCGWTDYSKSRPFTFLNATGWTHFFRGPLLCWAPCSHEAKFGLLPQLPPLRDLRSDHLIYIPKLRGIKDLSQAAKSGIHSLTAM